MNDIPLHHARIYGALGEQLTFDESSDVAALIALPAGWRYDEQLVVRDADGRMVDTAAWGRALRAARAREQAAEEARAITAENVAQGLAQEPYALQLSAPTSGINYQEAYEIERARATQLATQFEDVLGRYGALQAKYYEAIGEPIPDSVLEELQDFDEEFELTCCDGGHDEDESAHTDFRSNSPATGESPEADEADIGRVSFPE